MEDRSLMNPEYLEAQIGDTQDSLWSQESFAERVHEDIAFINKYFDVNQGLGEPTTLTPDQVHTIQSMLDDIDVNRGRYSEGDKVAIRAFKQLLTDRRWIIGSKLKFLRKK